MPDRPAKTLSLTVANARHCPSDARKWLPKRKRFGTVLWHAGFIHAF
jgi:hypothetical protein